MKKTMLAAMSRKYWNIAARWQNNWGPTLLSMLGPEIWWTGRTIPLPGQADSGTCERVL